MPARSCVTVLQLDDVAVLEVHELMTGPRRACVTVVGEVDAATEALLAEVVARTWAAGPVAVDVDLRRVTFLDAAGLRVLLLTSRTARQRAVPLVLTAAPGIVVRLLTMVGLGEQLRCRPVDDAAAGAPALHLVAPAVDRAPAPVGELVAATARQVRRPVLRVAPPPALHPISEWIGAAGPGRGR